MWEHRSQFLSWNSSAHLSEQVDKILEEHKRAGFELVQVVVLSQIGEAVVFMKKKVEVQ